MVNSLRKSDTLQTETHTGLSECLCNLTLFTLFDEKFTRTQQWDYLIIYCCQVRRKLYYKSELASSLSNTHYQQAATYPHRNIGFIGIALQKSADMLKALTDDSKNIQEQIIH